ncbi:rhomboid family intramembrane serine protease [Polymorphobacter sp. PAMC 29334]|uniref:rhomboid family intramembrane serine protease n=1 Tax=Polymorphobacter sp. PAMC 29334 TaxID=2862331 RepID=UPI001C680A9F|nr:rhomboid family intramembrane serine protease [Polymorphobacter sp. PAMC 29334]QYE34242.1 rhomboid family intramembrane serine protease [Polymorphobacter sp. PAMC 29334]
MKPEGGFGGASFTPPAAPVTRALVAVCVLVQVAATIGGMAFSETLASHAALIPARVTGSVPSSPGDVPAALTLLTSLFLHAGWIHLTLNLTFLWWVGRHVEVEIGRARFLVLYALSGIIGGLLQVAVAPHSTEAVVGASGAIAGVFGAYAVLFARSRARARRVLGIQVSTEVATALWYAATWIGLQLLTAVAFNTGEGGIAIWTHIGGFIVGLIFAQPFVRRVA